MYGTKLYIWLLHPVWYGTGQRYKKLHSAAKEQKQSTLNHINHLIKVMELLYIISAVCISVGAYDTIKQYYCIKQLDKQLKQSLTFK